MNALESVVDRTLRDALYPRNFYSACSPQDPAAIRATRIRREDYELWQSYVPADLEDIELVLSGLRRSTGYGERHIEGALFAHHRLRELPRLKRLQERLFHLDLVRLKAIDSVLCKIDADIAEHMRIVDEELTAYLTPTRPNQNLPSAGAIRRKLNAIILTLDKSISVDDSPAGGVGEAFSVGIDGAQGFIDVVTDAVTAHEIDERVRQHAAAREISLSQALAELVRGEGTTNIVLNMYRASDVEDAPGWISGTGWLSAEKADRLAAQASTLRDMDDLYGKTSGSYATPEDIRAVVIGWDGDCSFPGCLCHGIRAQMDHRVDFEEGGPTTAANLAALCQHHHNIKTDGRVRYIIDPDTREKFWLFEDGRWVSSEPTGPLSPKERHWLQTAGQRMQKRRERIRAESQEKRRQEVARLTGVSDPPPK
jgi:hypothetical protein